MTRTEAKAAGLLHYDTCKPCPHGHTPTVRYVLNGFCLACAREKTRRSYVTHRQMHLDASRRWKEQNKERVADYTVATRPRKLAKMAEYRAANHVALVAKKRLWRQQNPQKDQAQRRRYYAAHKEVLAARFAAWAAKQDPMIFRIKANVRRARLAGGGSHTKQDILAILKAQRGRCAYCRCNISNRYTVDHITPVIRGGSNDPNNLQLTCKPCNSSKGAKHPLDFARTKGLLV